MRTQLRNGGQVTGDAADAKELRKSLLRNPASTSEEMEETVAEVSVDRWTAFARFFVCRGTQKIQNSTAEFWHKINQKNTGLTDQRIQLTIL